MGEVLSLAQNNTFVRAEQDQFAPVEAVTDQYEQGMLGRIAEGAHKLGNIVKRGGAIMLGSLALGGAAEATVNTEKAQGASVTTNIAEITGNTTVTVAGSSMYTESGAQATVLGNHRVVSNAKVQKAKKEKRCKTVDGSEQEVWTEGLSGNGTRYGRDKRESTMCKVNVNGKNVWVRAKCGNRVRFKMPKKAVPGRIIWVNSLNKASLKVNSTAVARADAECRTATSSAKASGFGEGKSSAKVSYLSTIKSKALNKLIVSHKLSASADARSKAKADASASCTETLIPPVVVPPVTPKDGTQGAGEGTNTNTTPDGTGVGGPGADGQPGNPTNGEVCRNDAGDVVTGPSDQFGYCAPGTSTVRSAQVNYKLV